MKHFKTPISRSFSPNLKTVSLRIVAKYSLAFFALLLSAQVAMAAARTWTGAINGSWNNPGNWSPAFVPGGSDVVTIPNAGFYPQITTGVTAGITELHVLSGANLIIDPGGTLILDGAVGTGLENLGTIYNNGLIIAGTAFGIGFVGIEVKGVIENQLQGELRVNNCGNAGIFINGGEIYNIGKINIGNSSAVQSYGIVSTAGRLINSSSAQIKIDRSTGAAIHNVDGDFFNYGKMNIGNDAVPGVSGIDCNGHFYNAPGAEITINRSTGSGLYINGTTFENAGNLQIGNIASVGNTGINLLGTLNNSSGTIKIDRCTAEGIKLTYFGTLTNSASIISGSIASVGNYGINNDGGSITNFNSGTIKIDGAQSNGMRSIGGQFGGVTNKGTIKIGNLASNMQIGMLIDASFLNDQGALITIDRCSNTGLASATSYYPFSNKGNIYIGLDAAVGNYGLINIGEFENKETGVITINGSSITGLKNDLHFTNYGMVKVGNNVATIGIYGVHNTSGGILVNETPGQFQIDRATETGYFNENGHTINKGKLYIGGLATPGLNGLVNTGEFDNYATAEIQISRSTSGHLVNTNEWNNRGLLYIGMSGTPASDGFANTSMFINYGTGKVSIDRFSSSGLTNTGTIENHHEMSISSSGSTAIINTTSIENFTCATLTILDPIINTGNILQEGHMIVGSIGAHINSPAAPKVFKNNGILEYRGTNLIPGVVNTAVIVKPVTSECNFLNNVVTNANPGLYSLATTWYKDKALTMPGGTFDVATNTFFPTENLPVFYFNVHNNISACDQTASIITTFGDFSAPTVVCKNYTANLDANGTVTVTPANVMQSASDNCGAVTPQSVTPSVLNCSHIGTSTVVLKVSDSAGNTSTCVSTVTVKDVTAPAVTCNPYTAALNASGNATVTTANIFKTGSDNCGVVNQLFVTPSGFTCNNLGNHTVTLTVDDSHGNTSTCQATVTVVDNTAPTMICKPVSIALNAAGQAFIDVAQVNNGSFDNCSLVSMSLSQTMFTCASAGVNNIKLFGTDPSNNQGQCTATVTVTDPIKPTALCKNATVNLGANGSITVPGTAIDNGTSDNCTFTLSVTPANFNCGNIGQNTVTLKATDTAGNTSTCTAKVTIKDATAPTALCKNPTVYLDAVGQASLTIAQVNNGSSDACGIATMSLSKTQFNCSELAGSPWTVTLNMTDVNGNSSYCLTSVTVRDIIAPTAMCENITVALNSNGKVTVTGAEVAGDASFDNCSVWSYNPTAKVYTTANIGNNNLTVTVKDYSGNAATCTGVVTVTPYQNFGAGAEERGAANAVEMQDVMVYPNPAMNFATMEFELPQDQQYEVRMIDMTGRTVMQLQENGFEGRNALPLDLKGVASGVYVIEFQSGMLKGQQRLVVQNN